MHFNKLFRLRNHDIPATICTCPCRKGTLTLKGLGQCWRYEDVYILYKVHIELCTKPCIFKYILLYLCIHLFRFAIFLLHTLFLSLVSSAAAAAWIHAGFLQLLKESYNHSYNKSYCYFWLCNSVTELHMDENTARALHQYSKIALRLETWVCCIFIQGCEVYEWLSSILYSHIWQVMTAYYHALFRLILYVLKD